jgi:hypothetical protein
MFFNSTETKAARDNIPTEMSIIISTVIILSQIWVLENFILKNI